MSAIPDRRSVSVTWSRSRVALPPDTVRTSRSNARKVSGPHMPSAVTPTPFWNSRRATSVWRPNRPSMRPAEKPSSDRRRWSSATSSPLMRCPGTNDSTRSPRFQRASSRRANVFGPTMPSTVMPRSCWNARTATSRSSSKASPAGRSQPRSDRRCRTSATAGPVAPWRRITGATVAAEVSPPYR